MGRQDGCRDPEGAAVGAGGLTDKHDEALQSIGVKTVGDLGKWKYATRAAALVALAELDK